jgi:hypothetical protein
LNKSKSDAGIPEGPSFCVANSIEGGRNEIRQSRARDS